MMFFGAASCVLVWVGLGLNSHECVRLGIRVTHSTAIHLAMDFITTRVDGCTQETVLALVAPTAESTLFLVPLLEISYMVDVLAIQIICCRWFLGTASTVSLWRGRGGGYVLADEGEKERKNGGRKRYNKTRRGRGVGCALAHEWRMG